MEGLFKKKVFPFEFVIFGSYSQLYDGLGTSKSVNHLWDFEVTLNDGFPLSVPYFVKT